MFGSKSYVNGCPPVDCNWMAGHSLSTTRATRLSIPRLASSRASWRCPWRRCRSEAPLRKMNLPQRPFSRRRRYSASMWHLAQINVGRLVAPRGDPRTVDFFSALDRINALADVDPGFVWRLQDESGNASDIR